MVKISNAKKVNKLTPFIFSLLVIIGILIVLISFDFLNLKDDLFFLTFLFLAEILLLKFAFEINFFQYEDSGEVTSIKNYHCWKSKSSKWSLELPKNKIKSCEYRKRLFNGILSIIIERNDGRKQTIRYQIYFLQKEEIQCMLISLKKNKPPIEAV